MTIKPISPVRLSNDGGTIVLYNSAGQRIDRIKYSKAEATEDRQPAVFAYRYTSD